MQTQTTSLRTASTSLPRPGRTRPFAAWSGRASTSRSWSWRSRPGGEIGDEVHPDTDQVFLFVEGLAEARIDGRTSEVRADELTFVHAGSRHNILNRGSGVLRLITVYAPPAHAPDTIHETKADADREEH